VPNREAALRITSTRKKKTERERRSLQKREREYRAGYRETDRGCGNKSFGALAAAFEPLLLKAAAALFDEELFPILHALRGRINLALNQAQPAMAV
jgi:hypothetical protein